MSFYNAMFKEQNHKIQDFVNSYPGHINLHKETKFKHSTTKTLIFQKEKRIYRVSLFDGEGEVSKYLHCVILKSD